MSGPSLQRAATVLPDWIQPHIQNIIFQFDFVDQLVKECIVKLVQCRTNKMVADALTKNLQAPAFEQHRATMLGEDESPFSSMMCRV